MNPEILTKVIAMVNRSLDQPVEGLSAETKVLDIKGFDSLAMERLAGELQDELKEDINPMAFAQVESLADIADLIARARGATASPPRNAG